MALDQGQQYRSSTIALLVSARCQGCEREITLNREMALEALVRLGVVEDLLERSIFERGSVNITGHPIVIEHGCSLSLAYIRFCPAMAREKFLRRSRYRRGTCSPQRT